MLLSVAEESPIKESRRDRDLGRQTNRSSGFVLPTRTQT